MDEQEGFEQYDHVPQRSRRDKLRINLPHEQQQGASCSNFQGQGIYYDPSPFLYGGRDNQHQYNYDGSLKQNTVGVVKQEGLNPVSFASNSYLLDPLALHVNPTSVNHNTPYLYSGQLLRNQDIVPFKPQSSPQSLDEYRSFADKGLSLSLSSNQTLHPNYPSQLSSPQYDDSGRVFRDKSIDKYVIRGIIGDGGRSYSNDVRSLVPLGPFTGYTSILRGSRFLKHAQQLMEEQCNVARGVIVGKSCGDFSLLDPCLDNLGGSSTRVGNDEHNSMRSKLISMLDEVYRRYKIYYQQMQSIVASFESVAGLGNAAPYTSIAIKAMSKHFRSLKNSIIDQLRFTNKSIAHEGSSSKDKSLKLGERSQQIHGPKLIHKSRVHEDHPVWRPQRGLPDRAVAVLKAWLFEHFLHPYPTDNDKQMLARETGLSRSQVSNWFINARVRLWKPMVEEVHLMDIRQGKAEDQNAIPSLPDRPPQENTLKRSRNQFLETPGKNEPTECFYNNLSSNNHHECEVEVGDGGGGGNNGVSLTLGLRQNHGIGLREAFQMDVAHTYALGGDSEQGYMMASFEPQNHHFVKDFGGGRMLRDFVG